MKGKKKDSVANIVFLRFKSIVITFGLVMTIIGPRI